MIISRIAPSVAIVTARAESGCSEPSMMPGCSRNWRRTSLTMLIAARPTAAIVSAAKTNGISAPSSVPTSTVTSSRSNDSAEPSAMIVCRT